jgi:hypothetical protein
MDKINSETDNPTAINFLVDKLKDLNIEVPIDLYIEALEKEKEQIRYVMEFSSKMTKDLLTHSYGLKDLLKNLKNKNANKVSSN